MAELSEFISSYGDWWGPGWYYLWDNGRLIPLCCQSKHKCPNAVTTDGVVAVYREIAPPVKEWAS